MTDTLTSDYRRRLSALELEQADIKGLWQDLSTYILPRKSKYLTNTNEKNDSKGNVNTKIINSTATDANKTLAAGLQGGLTSPSRPWFALSFADEALKEIKSVRVWLGDVRNILLEIFQRSNFYGSIHSVFEELGPFGTGAMFIEEDFSSVVRFRPFTIGEYFLALDASLRPNSLYRKFYMTAAQMREKFTDGKDLSVLSLPVQNALRSDKNIDHQFEIVNAIQPVGMFKNEKSLPNGMTYSSATYESSVHDKYLQYKGFRDIPFIAPRWSVTATNVWGDSPGMGAIGDIKMLQKMETTKLQALDKQVNPPMNAPTSMKTKGGSIIAGAVNYMDAASPTQTFSPAYQVTPQLAPISIEIQNVENRIRNGFFNNLFLSILDSNKDMTATEVVERNSEKMLLLGPVIERLEAESLDIVIDRTFNIANDFGMIPPPPPEIAGRNIKIEYISILAQAQKLVGTRPIEQTANFVGAMAQFDPAVVDKFDFDESVDQFADAVGAPPKIVRSDDEVAAIRKGRAQQAQAAAAMQSIDAGANTAKTMSETQMGDGNALDALVESVA